MNELIEKYFEQKLSKNDYILFEKKLSEDTEFKKEFEFHSDLKNAISVSERQKLKNEMKQFEVTKKSYSLRLRNYYHYAAVFILAISLIAYLILNKSNNNDLYSAYFDAYPNTEIPNTRSDFNKNQLVNQAFIAYDVEDYSKAIELFDVVLKNSNENYIYFYKSISLMKLDQHAKALQIFEHTDWNNNYLEKTLWFKSLCYVKLNLPKEAKTTLLLLTKKKSFKYIEAQKLLSELNKRNH